MLSVLYPIMAMLQKKIPRNHPKQASLESQDAVARCQKFEAWMATFKEEASSVKSKKGKAMKAMNEKHEGPEEDEKASWEVNQDYCGEKEGEPNRIEGQEDPGQDQQRFTKEESISVPIFVLFLFELIMGTWHGSPA